MTFSRRQKLEPIELANNIVKELEDLKAEDIKLVDVTGKTPLCDFMVIATVLSPPQTQAISDRLMQITKNRNVVVRKVEGSPRSRWVLVDFGDVIVHLFGKEERLYYNLEDLWEKFSRPA